MDVWLIQYSRTREWEPEEVGIRSTEEGMREAVLAVARKLHGHDLEVRVISDNTIVYVHDPIPEGEVWVSANGESANTSRVCVQATQFELDRPIEELV